MEEVIRDLNSMNGEDIEELSSKTRESLRKIFSDRSILGSLLDSVLNNRELISLCEHYDFFDKVVLYKDELDRFRIRLHVFLEESHRDRPHNHRWAYSSVVLRGSYQHLIYGTIDQIDENTNVKDLKPIMIQEEKIGSMCTLNHDVIHSVDAEPYTVSVIIRGPSVKDRFLVTDKRKNKKWWEYGRESETIEEIRRKAMSFEYLKGLVDRIYEMGLVSNIGGMK